LFFSIIDHLDRRPARARGRTWRKSGEKKEKAENTVSARAGKTSGIHGVSPIAAEDTSFDLNSAITIDECRLRNQPSAVRKVAFALGDGSP